MLKLIRLFVAWRLFALGLWCLPRGPVREIFGQAIGSAIKRWGEEMKSTPVKYIR